MPRGMWAIHGPPGRWHVLPHERPAPSSLVLAPRRYCDRKHARGPCGDSGGAGGRSRAGRQRSCAHHRAPQTSVVTSNRVVEAAAWHARAARNPRPDPRNVAQARRDARSRAGLHAAMNEGRTFRARRGCPSPTTVTVLCQRSQSRRCPRLGRHPDRSRGGRKSGGSAGDVEAQRNYSNSRAIRPFVTIARAICHVAFNSWAASTKRRGSFAVARACECLAGGA